MLIVSRSLTEDRRNIVLEADDERPGHPRNSVSIVINIGRHGPYLLIITDEENAELRKEVWAAAGRIGNEHYHNSKSGGCHR